MAISYSKPTINTTPPEPPISKAEADRIRAANDAKMQAIADAADSLVTQVNTNTTDIGKLNAMSIQHIASGASAADLTAGTTYKFKVLTYGATYNSVVEGSGTGTQIMGYTASANLVLLII